MVGNVNIAIPILCFCLNSSIRYYILDSTHIQIVGDIFKSEFLQVIIY